jgi:23S rRNA (cytosine1962-C5)-methyltransferase
MAGGMSDLPIVRLSPKAEARAIRHGFPWIYADEIVLDRRTKALRPGTLAVLEDAERRPMGLIGFNPLSKIPGRMLDGDPGAEVGQAWFAARLSRALDLRQHLWDAPFYRLVHAEADGLPGVVKPNAAWVEARLDDLVEALVQVTGVTTVVKNGTGRARALEGMSEETSVLRGALSGPLAVPMNGATYFADLEQGQKTGLFYDQRENHAFAQRLSPGAEMLDVFAHVGGFGLAALAGGAAGVLAVDSSEPALALARRGAEAAGVSDRFQTRKSDAFAAMEALASEGRRFGLVVCDPPAFAPSRQALDAGLRAYERVARLAAPLVAPGGYLGLCSCSFAADLTQFRAACTRGIGKAGRRAQLIHTGFAAPDHPMLPQLAESGYLKALFFRLAP